MVSVAKKKRKYQKNELFLFRLGIALGIIGGFIGSFFASALFNVTINSSTPEEVKWGVALVSAVMFLLAVRIVLPKE